MSKYKAILMVTLLLVPVLAVFNNCGQAVGFKKATNEIESLDSLSTPLTPEELAEVEARIPSVPQNEEPRPVSDLEDDPALYELYKCPNSDGIVICHFPENVQAFSTQCVGRSAVKTHFDHIRQYSVGAELQLIGDYLGVCR